MNADPTGNKWIVKDSNQGQLRSFRPALRQEARAVVQVQREAADG